MELMNPSVCSTTVYKSQDLKAPKCSAIDEWVKMMWHTHARTSAHTHTHNGILSSYKKKEILTFAATQMNLGNIMLSGISQTQKDKYWIISLLCGI